MDFSKIISRLFKYGVLSSLQMISGSGVRIVGRTGGSFDCKIHFNAVYYYFDTTKISLPNYLHVLIVHMFHQCEI